MLKLRYIEKGKKINFDIFNEYVRKYYKDEFLKYSKEYKRFMEDKSKEEVLEQVIKMHFEELNALNNAILEDRDVFIICVKYPPNLDRGRHWYDMHYINEKGKVCNVWTPALMDKNRDKSCRLYGFSSSVIGMSRALDATDGLMSLLKRVGGCYGQFS